MNSKRIRVRKLVPGKGVVGEQEYEHWTVGREPRSFIVLRGVTVGGVEHVERSLRDIFPAGTPILTLPRDGEFDVYEEDTSQD